MSPGVQILIDQLKDNPDAFFGPITHDPREGYLAPRFHAWRQAIEEELAGIEAQRLQVKRLLPATWFLTDEEKAALLAAYIDAKRLRFDAEIIYALNRREEAPQQSYVYAQTGITTQYTEAMRLDSSGSLGIGTTVPSTLTGASYVVR